MIEGTLSANPQESMAKIIIKVPSVPPREVELDSGSYIIGRSSGADLQIGHSSVSSSHCQIMIRDGTVTVQDLGSTNGTFLDGQPVGESQIAPGQTLRLGEVELCYEPQPARPSAVKLTLPPKKIEAAPLPASRIQSRPKSFYGSIPGTFIYPFKRHGMVLLLSGTLIFGFFDFILGLRFKGYLFVGGAVAGLFGACITGYLFLYMQTIITASALGDNHMPAWPEYDSLWESAVLPYFRLLGIGAACVAPAMLGAMFAGQIGRWLIIPLLLAGCCYAPMATLAVAMDDSLTGLNPLLVFPAIGRVLVEYLVCCVLVGALFFSLFCLRLWVGNTLLPFVSQLAGMFLALYCLVVQMRLLGLLYRTKKARFGWQTTNEDDPAS
jgi:hypothetical protein